MITIKKDVWRSDCIQNLELNEDKVILRTIGDEGFSWTFNTEQEAEEAFKIVVTKWKQDLGETA